MNENCPGVAKNSRLGWPKRTDFKLRKWEHLYTRGRSSCTHHRSVTGPPHHLPHTRTRYDSELMSCPACWQGKKMFLVSCVWSWTLAQNLYWLAGQVGKDKWQVKRVLTERVEGVKKKKRMDGSECIRKCRGTARRKRKGGWSWWHTIFIIFTLTCVNFWPCLYHYMSAFY